MRTGAVAVAQFAPGSDTATNVATISALAEIAADRGASLIVFPEYSSYFSKSMGTDWLDAAEPVHGAFGAALSALARRLGVHIVAGMLERRAGTRFSNTLVAFAPNGNLVATYRKLHLYDAFGEKESKWVEPGEVEAPETFGWNDLTVGMQTCYDIRFPEVTRRIVDAGADLVLVPAEWVRGPLKELHWRTLVTARALENTIYVAAADHAPPIGAGNSMIVDPMGVEMVTIGENEGVALAWVDANRIADVRRLNPALANRRFSITPREGERADTVADTGD